MHLQTGCVRKHVGVNVLRSRVKHHDDFAQEASPAKTPAYLG